MWLLEMISDLVIKINYFPDTDSNKRREINNENKTGLIYL